MKTICVLLILMLSFISVNVFSQNGNERISGDTTDFRNSYQQEILLESRLSEEDDSELFEYLENLRRNPLDLNNVTADELSSIPFLNKITSENIIEYRKKVKSFGSKRELLDIEGITEDVYERIKVYFIVPESKRDVVIDETGNSYNAAKAYKFLSVSSRFRSRFIQDLKPKDGFITGSYVGSPPKIYNQINTGLRLGETKLEINITAEKDAGEKKLTDFVSGYVQIMDYKFIKNAVAGDYSLNFAQGLALSSISSFSKGIDAVTPLKKRGKGIDGHSSADEVRFFRGAAAKLFKGNFSLSLFYSNNNYDATIDTVSETLAGFYYDGYHRTDSEVGRMNSVNEKFFGGRLNFEKPGMTFGLTYWKNKFSKPVIPDTLRSRFDFKGQNAHMTGFDYDFTYGNINFFGEFALSQTNSMASYNAIHFAVHNIAELILSYRKYPYDFASVHSSSFGEKNNSSNESGFYAGITLRPIKGLLINGYYDQYKFPYRTYFDPVSVSGSDFLSSVEWRAVKGLILNFKYKNEKKELARTVIDEFNRETKRIDERNQLNARSGLIYQITDRLRLRSRFEYVYVDYKNFDGDSKGMLFFSDIRFLPVKGISADIRFIIFDTDNYDSRLYEFENDIKGVMSNTALYGKGSRWYVLLKYKPFASIEFSGKYSETYLDGAKSIGSGNDKISGDITNRISFGVEFYLK